MCTKGQKEAEIGGLDEKNTWKKVDKAKERRIQPDANCNPILVKKGRADENAPKDAAPVPYKRKVKKSRHLLWPRKHLRTKKRPKRTQQIERPRSNTGPDYLMFWQLIKIADGIQESTGHDSLNTEPVKLR
jgi:hypothetical protein